MISKVNFDNVDIVIVTTFWQQDWQISLFQRIFQWLWVGKGWYWIPHPYSQFEAHEFSIASNYLIQKVARKISKWGGDIHSDIAAMNLWVSVFKIPQLIAQLFRSFGDVSPPLFDCLFDGRERRHKTRINIPAQTAAQPGAAEIVTVRNSPFCYSKDNVLKYQFCKILKAREKREKLRLKIYFQSLFYNT